MLDSDPNKWPLAQWLLLFEMMSNITDMDLKPAAKRQFVESKAADVELDTALEEFMGWWKATQRFNPK